MDKETLGRYFALVHDRPTRLGHYDCVKFVVDGLLIGWQRDYRDQLGYWDRKTAVERLRAAGGLEAAFTAALGDPIAADDLQPGDVGLFFPAAVGLVMPGYVALKHRRTIIRVDKNICLKGWHGTGT